MNQKDALCAAAFLLLISASAHAESNVSVSPAQLKAKAEYCRTCHGVDAEGFRGAIPIPRLAGQPSEYVKGQLQAFITNTRVNPVMQNVARALSPAMVDGLASYFEKLDPKPLGGPPEDDKLAAIGKKIYKDGVSDDIPTCSNCHGDDAKGDGPLPRLAGQLSDYMYAAMTNWKKERGQGKITDDDTSSAMLPTVEGLNSEQKRAVAVYLSNLNK